MNKSKHFVSKYDLSLSQEKITITSTLTLQTSPFEQKLSGSAASESQSHLFIIAVVIMVLIIMAVVIMAVVIMVIIIMVVIIMVIIIMMVIIMVIIDI